MKIAIVCGHFIPSLGYLEVHLANAIHLAEHQVEVFTTDQVPNYVKSIAGKTDNSPYTVHRLPVQFSLGQMVKSKALVPAIANFSPALVICIGLGKLFPKPIYQLTNRKFKLITLLGDNEQTYTSNSLVKKLKDTLIQQVLKKQVYLKAIAASDVLLPYTPSTLTVINEFISPKAAQTLVKKSKPFSLGYDAQQFGYNETLRAEQRAELGIASDETLLITATRVGPEKELERTIDLIDEMNKAGVLVKYLIVGFQNDTYGKQLQQYIAQKENSHQIITKPFSLAEQINLYYNAADIALFNRAAISIFEAMATGLFLLLPQQQNVSHLLTSQNGVYTSNVDKQCILNSIKKAQSNRLERVAIAQQYSYRNLAQQIITYSEL